MARHASLAEEEAFFAAPRRDHVGSRIPSAALARTGGFVDGSIIRRGTGARWDTEPGCTVAALDYRQSRARRAVKTAQKNAGIDFPMIRLQQDRSKRA